MTDSNLNISIITLNANSLNIPNKDARFSDREKKKTKLYATDKKPTLNLKVQIC